jgi:hypothetical protein
MARVPLTLILALAILLHGCEQPGSTPDRQEKKGGVEQTEALAREASEPMVPETTMQVSGKSPTYQVASSGDCPRGANGRFADQHFRMKCLEVYTSANSEEGFTLLAQHFRKVNPGYRAGYVNFLLRHPFEASKNYWWAKGDAIWFADEKAAHSVLYAENSDISSTVSPSATAKKRSAETNEQVHQAMRNHGVFVYVLSVPDRHENGS